MVQLMPRHSSPEGTEGSGESLDLSPSHRSSPGTRNGGRGRHATGRSEGFEMVVGWTLLGSVVPGLGLVRAGRRLAGWVALGVVGAAVLAAVGLAVFGNPLRSALSVATNPAKLAWLAAAIVALALGWAALVVATHASLRRQTHLTGFQRAASSTMLVCLVCVGLLPAAKAANDALLTRQTLATVFSAQSEPANAGAAQPQVEARDPWATLPRVNVLLIGSDAGSDRYGVRPDTMIVASVDTTTGATVLFSLPRNLQRVPFPAGSPAAAAYPDGFYCINPTNGVNTDCLLNGVWTFAEQHAGDLYKGVKNPGLTATMQAAEAVTGLSINNYVLINLQGFKEFVNAIGGLTVTVRERLPIGGDVENPSGTTGWLEPGRQKLDGYHALWFARSRWSTSDFDRMRRQRCVIGAIAEQADPVTVAENLPEILRTAQRNIQTDISLGQLDAWVELAQRIKAASVRSLPFTDDVIDTAHPNFTRVHALVRNALSVSTQAPSGSTPSPSPTAASSTSTRRTPAPSPTASPSPSSGGPQPSDVREVC